MITAPILIVNADDFGRSSGVNRGIIRAHEQGIVTSASLMVRWPAAREAAAYPRRTHELGVGLHLDLGEWSYDAGAWRPLYEVVSLDDEQAVRRETQRQLDAFRRLVGRDPTHVDSHQHVHKKSPVKEVALALADRLGVPLRHFSNDVRYCGAFYGQADDGSPNHDAVGVDALAAVLDSLPPGVTELACHPALGDDVEGMYRAERAVEVDTLCDPRIRARVERLGIKLASFADLTAESPAWSPRSVGG